MSKERNTKKANNHGTPVLLVDHCHSQQTHPLGCEATKSRRTRHKHEQAHKHLCLYLTGDYPEPGVLRYTRSPRLNWNLPPSCKHKEERTPHSACICSVHTVHHTPLILGKGKVYPFCSYTRKTHAGILIG